MTAHHFDHVRHWVFDLDNTLYPPKVRLFDQIEQRMTVYVMEALGVDKTEADHLRQHYWKTYGTTLAGLMDVHGVDPGPYLTEVHDISFDALTPDPELAALIKALPGRCIVYTNGTAPYAERVIEARGLNGLFDGIYGVEHANFRPKPERAAFETVFGRAGVHGPTGAMFEDDPRNLAEPHAMGLRTVHVAAEPTGCAHIQHHTTDLNDFLSQILDPDAPADRTT